MKTRLTDNGYITFWCNGCNEAHSVSAEQWKWNGDRDKPTLGPSVKITSGHHSQNWQGTDCWCTYNKEHADNPSLFTCGICHFVLTEGIIYYQNDCTHELANKSIPLPDWNPEI